MSKFPVQRSANTHNTVEKRAKQPPQTAEKEEAITEQGSIHLAASRSGDIITITCTDTGCGITPEQMECIFQPFVTYKPGGTGLGLAFSRKIAEAHEGTLTAVSTPQESTTFTVTLPV